MTPLLGTKTSSAPIGDVPAGDERAARATAFKVFHETRDTKHSYCLARRASQREFRGFTKHESRNTNHGRYASLPTISHDFPAFPTISRPPHPPGKGSARRSVAAFLRVVARHGAAMARHGRPPSPAPATRPVGFSPATNHATCFPPVLRRLQREQPQARPTGFHESRPLCFSRCFPASCGAAWGGYGAAWAAYCPRAGVRARRSL